MLPYDTGICCCAFSFINLLLLSIPFLYFLKNLILMNQQNGPQFQHVLALCAFFNRGNTEGTNALKQIVLDVCVCFVIHKFVSGLILWFLGNLRFDDLCEE